jgi:hypothetical protein
LNRASGDRLHQRHLGVCHSCQITLNRTKGPPR